MCYKTSRLVHTVKYFIFFCYFYFFISIHNQLFELENLVGYFCYLFIWNHNQTFQSGTIFDIFDWEYRGKYFYIYHFDILIWNFVRQKTLRLVHTVKYFIFSCYFYFFISIRNQLFELENLRGIFLLFFYLFGITTKLLD